MTQSTLTDIRNKVRKLTARPSVNQISNSDIDDYVNSYYVYDLPNSMKLDKLEDVYTFETQPNVDTYDFDLNTYYLCRPPVYCAGYEVDYETNNSVFYREWYKNSFIEDVATGDGGNGPYTGTIFNTPFLRSVNAGESKSQVINVVFTGETATGNAVAEDNGVGGFLAPATGTIDYVTGAFSVTFDPLVSILTGTTIKAQTFPYQASRPRTMLYFQNQFTLRPVPDMSYKMEINVIRAPTDLLDAGSSPELNSLWELLAFGASVKILIDNGDYDILGSLRPCFEETLRLAQRRTISTGSFKEAETIYNQKQTRISNNYFQYL